MNSNDNITRFLLFSIHYLCEALERTQDDKVTTFLRDAVFLINEALNILSSDNETI